MEADYEGLEWGRRFKLYWNFAPICCPWLPPVSRDSMALRRQCVESPAFGGHRFDPGRGRPDFSIPYSFLLAPVERPHPVLHDMDTRLRPLDLCVRHLAHCH